MDVSQETGSSTEAKPPTPSCANNSEPSFDGKGRLPPHSTQDDPLLACLVDITRLHGTPFTAQALSAGLPLVNQRLTASLLERAAARAKYTTRIFRRDFRGVAAGLLPAILILRGNRAALLLQELEAGARFLVQFPETGTPVEMTAQELEALYAGFICFVRPQFQFEKRAKQELKTKDEHWFWSAVLSNKRLYRDALLAAVLINLFALAIPLFSMNVYDRVVPNNAIETLWVLVIGVSLVLLFNFALTTARAYVVDTASKRIDVKLSAQIMEQVLDLRMESRPASVGSFAANLRSFESVRDFIASASLTTLVDLPFVLLFLLVLAWISPWMVIPPLFAIVLDRKSVV